MLTATECSQLLKIPKLVIHFKEHQNLDSNLSFFEFLYMHYTDHDINDNDQDKDMQLPFKSHSDYASTGFVAWPAAEMLILRTVPIVTKNYTSSSRVNFQSSFLSSIWQPPKSC